MSFVDCTGLLQFKFNFVTVLLGTSFIALMVSSTLFIYLSLLRESLTQNIIVLFYLVTTDSYMYLSLSGINHQMATLYGMIGT